MMSRLREWSARKKDSVAAFFIFIISCVTHLLYFGAPAGVVFDETYFLKFVGFYETGSYYFDIHPPLGKLIFLVFAHMIGVTPSIEIGNIGAALPPSLILLRLLPIVAGILLPVVVYYLCRRLKLSALVSLAASILICFENSLIVESRFVLMDSTLLL
ncbi:MAG: phospholipid carrier-dependent glycosyltransferase, partial [Patescibacteria group bacterium]